MIWYEWLDEIWAVLGCGCFIEFGFRVKILICFLWDEKTLQSFTFNIFFVLFVLYIVDVFIGVMGAILLIHLYFDIFIYVYFDYKIK